MSLQRTHLSTPLLSPLWCHQFPSSPRHSPPANIQLSHLTSRQFNPHIAPQSCPHQAQSTPQIAHPNHQQ
jgi:hypothetical protein